MGAIETKTLLLQALISGDSYGLELIGRIRKDSGGRFLLPQGMVYPALRALEAEGLLESYDGEPLAERGGRPRRYYRITAKGMRVARQDAKAITGFFAAALDGVR